MLNIIHIFVILLLSFGESNKALNINTKVDAFWPPDQQEKEKTKNLLWPGVIKSVDLKKKTYEILFNDGNLHASINWSCVFLRKTCNELDKRCLQLAKNDTFPINIQNEKKKKKKTNCKICESGKEMFVSEKSSQNVWDFEIIKKKIEKLRFGENRSLRNRNILKAKNLLLEELKILTQKNNLCWALNSLGLIHMMASSHEKDSVVRNVDIARTFFEKSASYNSFDAQFYLGYLHSIHNKTNKALLHYYFASNGGSILASLALGFKHSSGFDIPKNCENAIQYYMEIAYKVVRKEKKKTNKISSLRDFQKEYEKTDVKNVFQYQEVLADGGDAGAQFQIGLMNHRGVQDMAPNPEEAVRRFAQAADQGNGLAHAMLGQSFLHGDGVEANNATALKHLEIAADLNVPEGLIGLAILYHQGLGVKQDLQKAIKYYAKAAERGNAKGQFQLGLIFFSGKGVLKEYSKALKYFSQAAMQGYTKAIYYVGWMHRNGLATIKNCRMALQLFQIVSQRSSILEITELAKIFYKKDLLEEAFWYYTLASEVGYEVAQTNAGYMAHRTESLDASERTKFQTAYRYYQYSSEQGNADSQRIIGDFYFYKWSPINETLKDILKMSTEQAINFREAVYYYDLATKNTNKPSIHAMWNLGYMYQYGLGRSREFGLAKRYFDLAYQQSNEATIASLNSLGLLYVEKIWRSWVLPIWNSIIISNYEIDLLGSPKPKPKYLEIDNIVLIISSFSLFVLVLLKQFKLGRIQPL